MDTPTTARLRQIINAPEPELDLAEAALLIAKEEYSELDISAYIARLDGMGETLRARVPGDATAERKIHALNSLLFEELGYGGPTKDFYDPRNSFLNDVIDRKIGIPIALSVLYMEVGRRVGLPIEGVSFPGHFLVKLRVTDGALVMDPFSGGASLDEDDIQRRLQLAYGGQPPPDVPMERLLGAATKKDILVRMLRNLKAIYTHTGELLKALSIVDRILIITPEMTSEFRDRGLIYQDLECFRPALADIQCYLETEPQADDAAEMRDRIIELQRLTARMN
ncbi:MAG: SirB1 family protein [Methyloceanibacter sp.]